MKYVCGDWWDARGYVRVNAMFDTMAEALQWQPGITVCMPTAKAEEAWRTRRMWP